jgi:TIR domain
MADIFISYSHKDLDFVRSMIVGLEVEKFSVWWDHTIPPGKTWDDVIARGIKDAKACIIVWSEASVTSDWVKEEAALAKECRKYLPVRIGPDSAPIGFSRIQSADLRRWNGNTEDPQWQLLIREATRLVRGDTEPSEREQAANPPVAGRLGLRKYGLPIGMNRHKLATSALIFIGLTAALSAWWIGRGTGLRKNAPVVSHPAASASDLRFDLAIDRVPPNADVFVDGTRLKTASLSVSTGTHEVVAVAPRYYGEVRHVSVSSGSPLPPISLALEATGLPPLDEELRFLKIADSAEITAADLDSVTERTLHTALRAKFLRQIGAGAEFEQLSHDVQTLRRFGDARAAVAALLIDSVQTGHVTRAQITPPLLSASDGGDAMASLFVAVADREALNSSKSPISRSDPQFRSYCRRLSLSVTQGWSDVAADYWRRDDCR